MANYLPHFAEAWRRHKLVADQNVLLNTITNSHNFNFTNIVLPSILPLGQYTVYWPSGKMLATTKVCAARPIHVY